MNEQPQPTPQQWAYLALNWLADHPNSSTGQITLAINCPDGQMIEGLLKAAERAGKVDRYSEGHIWIWQVIS